ncbi:MULTISPECIES: LLM class flavin-dependent oxidoreductase [Streptomyces]|uniref:LLM class flavin-dependent oxidoreductase n=1 Tax=Streptomyces TaxID=1883 RepID=UPI000241B9D6|nr:MULTISPECIES: LLM class flavin-dependent oxidoreductase [Streptomyces]EHM24335.1 oxidoreductase [Streptomyces sp. W007]WTD29721.1 LLM class flavin-dependent oxidoreductase [Streptomyces anulatus]
MAFELGIYHFGELTPDPSTGALPAPGVRLRELVEQARAADEAGLDVFAVGEHHRTDFVVSSPAVVLAAMAENTSRIKLSSAVTVLSSDDPVRVFQQFATLDLLSGGRAEIIAGRGSYTESFPVFGYDLNDYSQLFAEKLDLLLRLREENPVSWQGTLRPTLVNGDITPRPDRELPVWVAVGGTPASVVRAGRLGLPLSLAIIGGSYRQFAPFVDLYREAAAEAGHDPDGLKVSINSPGFLAPTHQEAIEVSHPSFQAGWMANHHQRGQGVPMPKAAYEAQATPAGAFFLGSPQEVIDKIMAQYELFRHDRMMIQLGFGNVPQKEALKSIELLGSEVAPVVRKEIAALDGTGVTA